MIVVAQLSDPHLNGEARNNARAATALRYVDGLPGAVDAVLLTGDLADHGTAAQYAELRALLPSGVPVVTCLGNHDVRSAFRTEFLGEPASGGPVNQVLETGAAVYLLADSTIPGENGGFLDDETVSWLDAELSDRSPGKPVFLAMHHPPVAVRQPYIDGMLLRDPDRLAGLIDRNPRIAAVLCGHAHTAAATGFAGRPLRIAPSLSSTLTFPWEGEEILSYDHPPSLAFHVLGDDGSMITHYRVLS